MREVYKYNTRLNVDGSQMQPGRDYDLTYAPVASGESILSVVSADPEIQMAWPSHRHRESENAICTFRAALS
jgi:hypothetical protein